MTPHSLRLWLLAALTGSVVTLSSQTPPPMPEGTMPGGMPPPAQTLAQPTNDEEMIDGIKLTEATIDHVLMLLEEWTGRTVLRPQQLPTPTFAINIKRRLPKSEAIQAMETLLNLNGIGIIPVGEKFMKVVDLPRVRMEAPTMIDGSTLDLPPSGQVMSKLFQLEFQRVTEFLPQINMLLNGNIGGYVVFEKSNAALITDSVSTLQRIELLIKKLDQPLTTGMTPKFYTVRFAKASDIVNKINAIVQGPLQNQLGSATKFSADDRTNQIVLLSDARQYPFFDDLISKLDVKADPNTRNEVIFLKHAASKDVATLLSNLISGQNKGAQSSGSVRPNQFGRPNPQPGQPPEPVQPQPMAMGPMGDLGVSTNEFSSLVNIQPDERSNAVVVSGTVDDIRLIQELVDKVDVLLPQVRIELVITEVTLSDADDTGIQALNLDVKADRLVGFTGSLAGALGTAAAIAGRKGEDFATVSTNPTNGNIDLSGVLQLSRIKTKGRATILSAPSITTTHNKEGIIIVSTQVPTISGFVSDLSSGTGGTGTTGGSSAIGRTSVSEKDIGLTLSVKPLIGNDGTVQLEVKQELSEPQGTVKVDGNDQPIVSRRSTESFISARSGEIIVLGGLQRKTATRNRYRLGPIPIIGDLLGGRSKNYERTDLVIFLRPQVLSGDPRMDNTSANARVEQMGSAKEVKQALEPQAPESSATSRSEKPLRTNHQ